MALSWTMDKVGPICRNVEDCAIVLNAIYGADGLPFLASSYPTAKKLADAQKPALDKLLASQGMKLLYTVAWPPQGIYVNKEITSVADMKGLKWRAYSPATAKIAELIGAQPVTVQAAELSQALATGVVDSYMSSGSTGYDSKTYEHIKNWYNTQAWLPKNAVIVNAAAFNALDKPTQDAVLKAAADAETRGWKLSEEKNGWYIDQLKSGEVKIYEAKRYDVTVHVYGNVATAMGMTHLDLERKGVRSPIELRYINVWVLRDGRWQLVARQSAFVPK